MTVMRDVTFAKDGDDTKDVDKVNKIQHWQVRNVIEFEHHRNITFRMTRCSLTTARALRFPFF